MRKLVTNVLLAGACVTLLPAIALARPQYMGAFNATYKPKAGGALAGAKCSVCHVAGKPKSERNPYGKALEKALGKENATPEEATAGLKKIEKDKAEGSKTSFGDLIKADKLPGG